LPAVTVLLSALLLTSVPAWAGPPLICQPIDIGSAKSLPWKSATGWQGVDPSYDVARLSDDTLALLTPGAPVPVRRETLRRAALYAATEAGLAEQLVARLAARALDAEAAGKPDPLAWFDAGYFAETLRQAAFVYRFEMLTPEQQAAWIIRDDAAWLDGYSWVEKAIRMGGKDMKQALPLIEAYRKADRPYRAAPNVAARR